MAFPLEVEFPPPCRQKIAATLQSTAWMSSAIAFPPPSDEDLSVEYDDSTCLNWKKILSLTNDYNKTNSFPVEKNVLISLDYILPKAM
jgi:hypothetical protein